MTTPRIVRFDWERFHARIERLRVEHATRTPAEAVGASLAAFKRWGVAPPASFKHAMAAAAAGRHGNDLAAGERGHVDGA
jgi:hypothetical protein